MPRDVGTPVVSCACTPATLIVEVARWDEEPLSGPARVSLRGPTARAATTTGTPARARFDNLQPGRYAVALELDTDDEELEPTGDLHESFTLADSDCTAVRIELRGDWEVTTAGVSLHEDMLDSVEDDDEEDDDDGDVVDVTLATQLDE